MKHYWNTTREALRTTLGNRSLRRALPAYLLFACGEEGVWLAVSVYAYREGGVAAVGMICVAQLIPAVLAAPLLASLVDRMPRGMALTVGYGVQFLTTVLLAASMLGSSTQLVYAAAILASCAVTFTRPAHHALLPRLAKTPEELTAANALTNVMEGLGVMLGPALVAGVLLTAEIGAAPALFAATFATATLLTARAGFGVREDRREAVSRSSTHRVREMTRGLGAMASGRGTLLLVFLGGGQFLVSGMLDVFFVALAVEVLGRGEAVSGLLVAAGGVGGLAGGAASAALAARARLTPAVGGGLVLMGAGLAMIAFSPTLAVMVTLIGIVEAGRAFFDVAARTLLQRLVDPRNLARLFGVQESLVMLSLAAGAAAAPLLAAQFGLQGAFIVAACLVVTCGLASWWTLRHLDDRATIPSRERIERLERIPIFSPLPQHALEQVANQMFPLSCPVGTVVIRERDAGDHFYLLTEGRAAVESAGKRIATCRRGDYFGEIALLRDVPRTATVRAITDVRLLALGRDDFLSAATRSSRGLEAAHAEIDRRLAELRARQRWVDG